GASRSRAYELREELRHVLPSLLRPVGRPPSPPRNVDRDVALALCGVTMAFIKAHPGCVSERPERHYYSDVFRRFILELREQHSHVELEHFATAVTIPLGTLKEWLAAGIRSGADDASEVIGDTNAPGAVQPSAEIQVVLASWKGWEGTFRDFCKYLREEQRVSFGPALISNILSVYGKRRPRRRPGRSPDEDALRNAFATFFGGAQWTGDGSPVAVTLNGERFVFNLELMVELLAVNLVSNMK